MEEGVGDKRPTDRQDNNRKGREGQLVIRFNGGEIACRAKVDERPFVIIVEGASLFVLKSPFNATVTKWTENLRFVTNIESRRTEFKNKESSTRGKRRMNFLFMKIEPGELELEKNGRRSKK